jgi:hypothetical protein
MWTWFCLWSRRAALRTADAKVLALVKTSRCLLIANKLDNVHRRGDIAPWLQSMHEQAMRSPNSCPCRPKTPKDVERLLVYVRRLSARNKPWWYSEDELTDRSEKFPGQRNSCAKSSSALRVMSCLTHPLWSSTNSKKKRVSAQRPNACCALPPP